MVSPALGTSTLRSSRHGRGDRYFRGLSLGAGLLVLAILAAIAVFLVWQALPAISQDRGNFLTTRIWSPDQSLVFGIAALFFGTMVSSALALLFAVPVALGVALYIVEYAPRRLSRVMGYAVDMLAAVPSVVYGLWALYFLLRHLVPLQQFLGHYFGWIPLLSSAGTDLATISKSLFAAGIILAIMILPIIAAIAREVFRQVDPAHREAALALGATRWEMIRTAVLPPSRGGLVGAIMLGLGRALGETIAVALILAANYTITAHLLSSNGNTFAANIATQFAEAGSVGRGALIASGLVLFGITLAVSLTARGIIYRAGKVERSLAV